MITKKLFIFLLVVFYSLTKNITYAYAETALLLYANDKKFLGCINCNKYDKYSIWNEYGDYGSKYIASSIWNQYAKYGGKYSLYSPFNPYSHIPPRIVDQRGNFYGYLTANRYHAQRANNTKLIVTILSIGSKQ